MTKITISLIKADVGGYPGHSSVHPALIETAESKLEHAKKSGALTDFRVLSCGDDLELLMSHKRGCDDGEIHGLAWETFEEATEKAKKLKLYGAGQDLLADAFSGNIRGLGPGVAEMEFTERIAEPVVAFMMDKTEPGAFNLPIFKMFADPFNTAGLVIDPGLHHGFAFEVWDIMEHKKVFMNCPEEMYDLLALIGAKSRYVIKRVYPKAGGKLPEMEPVAAVSTEKLYQTAGTYVGKDDPVALVRSQSGLPALGEVLEPFALAHLVSGWMRGSHNGPLMPCAFEDAHPTRFDGPPRVIAAGFQMAYGNFVGPVDLFKDPAFDNARRRALDITDYLREHGPFEPHRLPMEDMEYTTLPHVMKNLGSRFADVAAFVPFLLPIPLSFPDKVTLMNTLTGGCLAIGAAVCTGLVARFTIEWLYPVVIHYLKLAKAKIRGRVSSILKALRKVYLPYPQHEPEIGLPQGTWSTTFKRVMKNLGSRFADAE